MDKTQEILFHIEELYSEKPSQFKVEQMCKANPTRYQMWVDAFKDYDLSDVLWAINNFWEFKSSKTKPNVAQIKAILSTHNAEKIKQTTPAEDKITYPTPTSLMDADVESGNCHHNLPTYEAAYRLVTQDWLAEILPADIYATTRFPNNIALAYNNGLFYRFDEAFRIVSQKKFGADIQFLSKNDMDALKQQGKAPAQYSGDAIKTLSAHWSAL